MLTVADGIREQEQELFDRRNALVRRLWEKSKQMTSKDEIQLTPDEYQLLVTVAEKSPWFDRTKWPTLFGRKIVLVEKDAC